ncbi:hypothetical protein FA15DRAFT_288208 [Coprinopsis marcescibilis]|uniref:Uncharacterized protein n=1 Tax=Coprinopsis marcescibilis TaxID=230819 RepID=A0A5C3LCP0_COPMA|nr:hypothetical protein FA15DRAFT_288208 [Coprinopsis marcescibilis]
MGFLKRLLSLGSKKHKKPKITHNVPLPDPVEYATLTPTPLLDEADHEAAMGRLLRSSSQRYAVVAEVDYTMLPPMPHPINAVIGAQAGASTVSIASTTLGSRSTYNVTVHKREQLTPSPCPTPERRSEKRNTESRKSKQYEDNHLNANESRVLRLRSDPSVISLVSLYDEHGRLPDAVFSNEHPSPEKPAPEKTERAQCKRSGSTLRMLLGAPASSVNSRRTSGDISADEGDISWAERFLEETSSNSTHSSLPLQTPISERVHFLGDVSMASMMSDGTMDNPAISSMDVELSISTDASHIFGESFQEKPNISHKISNPGTPQRASQVFDFIHKKRQSKFVDQDERPLPDPPSAFSSPSSQATHSQHDHLQSQFSEDSCESAFARERIAAIPIPSDTPRNSRRISNETDDSAYKFGTNEHQDSNPFSFTVPLKTDEYHHEPREIEAVIPEETVAAQPSTPQDPSKIRPFKVIMSGPTKVIVTAPTPSTNHPNSATRIPRGPRSLAKRRSNARSSDRHRRSGQIERSNTGSDTFSAIPTRRRTSHTRTSSLRSNSTMSENDENDRPKHRTVKDIFTGSDRKGKGSTQPGENAHKISREISSPMKLGVRPDIPLTPLRTQNTNLNVSSGSMRSSLKRTAVNTATFEPPTSISGVKRSSSAVTDQMSPGVDLKQQRMKAREAEREKLSLYSLAKRSSSTMLARF